MKRIVLLIGLPASGKSSLSKTFSDRGYVRLSLDDIRQEVNGDVSDQSNPESIVGVFHARLEEALGRQADIVVDNTNVVRAHRRAIILRAQKAGYQDIQLWWLKVPLGVCLERNCNRERRVPEAVIVDMYRALQGRERPRRYEGRIKIIRHQPAI